MKLSSWQCRTTDSVHVGPAGVLALADHVTRLLLEGMLADAREFVAEWLEMRPVYQHRLFGQCLRAPLQVYTLSLLTCLAFIQIPYYICLSKSILNAQLWCCIT